MVTGTRHIRDSHTAPTKRISIALKLTSKTDLLMCNQFSARRQNCPTSYQQACLVLRDKTLNPRHTAPTEHLLIDLKSSLKTGLVMCNQFSTRWQNYSSTFTSTTMLGVTSVRQTRQPRHTAPSTKHLSLALKLSSKTSVAMCNQYSARWQNYGSTIISKSMPIASHKLQAIHNALDPLRKNSIFLKLTLN
jgi:hypothetical protein